MSRFLNKSYEQMEAYIPGEQPRDMAYIKLNTNENPYPPAPSVLKAIGEVEIENLRLYSDPTCLGLKEKLASLYGVKIENIFVGNGSDDILNFLFMAYSRENGVVFADITYGFYSVYATLYGADTEIIPLEDDFSIDYRRYLGKDKMVVIANPNAPTGLALPITQIEEIAATNPNNIVVIDEAYVDFGGESALPLITKYDNLVVVRTFSKSRSMAGARLGYAFACPALINDLEKLRYSTNPYNINRMTLLLGEKTVDNNDYTVSSCEKIIATRERTAKKLNQMGFTVIPSKTNFLFAKYPCISGRKLYAELKQKGILVRYFAGARTAEYIRITIGTDAQMERFIEIIREITRGGNYA